MRRNLTVSALKGRSESGLDLQWYRNAEYNTLTKERQEKLRKWRETEEGQKTTKTGMEDLKKRKREAKETKRSGKKSNGVSVSATKSKR